MIKKILNIAILVAIIAAVNFCSRVVYAERCELDVERDNGDSDDPCMVIGNGKCSLGFLINKTIGDGDEGNWCTIAENKKYAGLIMLDSKNEWNGDQPVTVTIGKNPITVNRNIKENEDCSNCEYGEGNSGDPIIIAGYDVKGYGLAKESSDSPARFDEADGVEAYCEPGQYPENWEDYALRDRPWEGSHFMQWHPSGCGDEIKLPAPLISRPSEAKSTIMVDRANNGTGFILKNNSYVQFRYIRFVLRHGSAMKLIHNNRHDNQHDGNYLSQVAFKGSRVLVEADNTAKYVIHAAYPGSAFRLNVMGHSSPLHIMVEGHDDYKHQMAIMRVNSEEEVGTAVHVLSHRIKLKPNEGGKIPRGVSLVTWLTDGQEEEPLNYCEIMTDSNPPTCILREGAARKIIKLNSGGEILFDDPISIGRARTVIISDENEVMFNEYGRRIPVVPRPFECPPGSYDWVRNGTIVTCTIDYGVVMCDESGKPDCADPNSWTHSCNPGYVLDDDTDVCRIDYTCPENTEPELGVSFPASISDCQPKSGFRWYDEEAGIFYAVDACTGDSSGNGGLMFNKNVEASAVSTSEPLNYICSDDDVSEGNNWNLVANSTGNNGVNKCPENKKEYYDCGCPGTDQVIINEKMASGHKIGKTTFFGSITRAIGAFVWKPVKKAQPKTFLKSSKNHDKGVMSFLFKVIKGDKLKSKLSKASHNYAQYKSAPLNYIPHKNEDYIRKNQDTVPDTRRCVERCGENEELSAAGACDCKPGFERASGDASTERSACVPGGSGGPDDSGDNGGQQNEPENTDALCSDGEDNDASGYADCHDPNCDGPQITVCRAGETAAENTEAACADQSDNDGDDAIDCADTECRGFSNCVGGGGGGGGGGSGKGITGGRSGGGEESESGNEGGAGADESAAPGGGGGGDVPTSGDPMSEGSCSLVASGGNANPGWLIILLALPVFVIKRRVW